MDRDDAPYLAHSEDGRLAIAASGRVHAFWTDFSEGDEADIRHAAFDPNRGTLPADFEVTGPLLVSKPGPGVNLTWSDARPETTHYDVLEGTIASLHAARTYDHAGNPCGLPRSAPASPSTSLDAPIPSVDTYWLIAAGTCAGTGPAGYDSFGNLTPPAGVGPACGPP